MNRNSNHVALLRLLIVFAGTISPAFWGCEGGTTVAPESLAERPESGPALSSGPTELSSHGLSVHSHVPPDAVVFELDPPTLIAHLDPYRINQPPDFMMHSRATSDFIIRRSSFPPGDPGPWHTHPGLSFAYVIQGRIKLQKFTKHDGCFETAVYGPGEVYIKPPDEVHRVVVVGTEEEVELIVSFFPSGAAYRTLVDDPGCPEP